MTKSVQRLGMDAALSAGGCLSAKPESLGSIPIADQGLCTDEELSRAEEMKTRQRGPPWGRLEKVTKHDLLWGSRDNKAKVGVQ